MIIGKPKDQNVTRVGQPFFPPSPEPQLPERGTVSELDGLIGLRRTCGQLEAGIGQLAEDISRNGADGADGRVLGMFKAFAADTQTLLDGMQPGAARARVVAAAKRDGKALMNEAATTLETAKRRSAATQIAGIAQGLAARVAADPARLGSARRTITELTGAAELPVVEADAVRRQSFAAIEAVASRRASPSAAISLAPEVRREKVQNAAPASHQVFPSQAGAASPEGVKPRLGSADESTESSIEEGPPNGPGNPANANARDDGTGQGQTNRNALLEANGFAFVEGPEESFWVTPDGQRASPLQLRDVVVDRLDERAETEDWSSARILDELHRAKEGLPKDNERNIETAFFFLPFLPFVAAGGATATGGVATVGAGITAGGVLKAILGGVGLAAILGLRGDTPLNDIEQVDALVEKRRQRLGKAHSNNSGEVADGRPEDKRKLPAPIGPAPAAAADDDDDRELVRVYRVETSHGARQRIIVHADGFVTIRLNGKRMLHLNFGQRARAIEFLEQKILKEDVVDPVIKSFMVPKELLNRIRRAAIEQDDAKETDPLRLFPRIVDETKAPDQFELPTQWILKLKREIVQPRGRVERPENVLP